MFCVLWNIAPLQQLTFQKREFLQFQTELGKGAKLDLSAKNNHAAGYSFILRKKHAQSNHLWNAVFRLNQFPG